MMINKFDSKAFVEIQRLFIWAIRLRQKFMVPYLCPHGKIFERFIHWPIL